MLKKLSVFVILLLMITGCTVQPGFIGDERTSIDRTLKDESPIIVKDLVKNGNFETSEGKPSLDWWSFYNKINDYKSVKTSFDGSAGKYVLGVLNQVGPVELHQTIETDKAKVSNLKFHFVIKSNHAKWIQIQLGKYNLPAVTLGKGIQKVDFSFNQIILPVKSELVIRTYNIYKDFSTKDKIMLIDNIKLIDETFPVILPL